MIPLVTTIVLAGLMVPDTPSTNFVWMTEENGTLQYGFGGCIWVKGSQLHEPRKSLLGEKWSVETPFFYLNKYGERKNDRKSAEIRFYRSIFGHPNGMNFQGDRELAENQLSFGRGSIGYRRSPGGKR